MRILSAILFVSFLTVGCNNAENQSGTSSEPEAPAGPPASLLNDEGTQKLLAVLGDYYALKDGLVATDGTEAAGAAEKLTMSTADLQMFVVNDSATNLSVKENLDTVNKMSLRISQTHPGEVEQMRADFEKVSDNIFAALKKLKLQNAKVYQQYCPMAFDDKGAYWLSSEEKIRNPYFGKKMLSCGEVTDSL
jgi:Cu(I)/Ag(I) efflux system membrane fusion protein